VVRTDEAGKRAYGHVITKLSRMGRSPNFRRYGAPLLELPFYEEKLSFFYEEIY